MITPGSCGEKTAARQGPARIALGSLRTMGCPDAHVPLTINDAMCKWRRLGIAALLLASSSVVALAGDSGAGGPARKKNPKKHARRSRLASIAAIDSSSDSSSSRISIRTTKAVRYRVAALRNPRRIYLDLIHTQIAEAAKKALPAGADGPITRIRASQNRAGVTRI